jgi:hypothetical protein
MPRFYEPARNVVNEFSLTDAGQSEQLPGFNLNGNPHVSANHRIDERWHRL